MRLVTFLKFGGYHILTALLVTSVLFSCERNLSEPLDMGHEYFDLQAGKWMLYQVDSIVYDDFTGEVREYSYQVKEHFKEEFIDSRGLPAIRIERFIRNSELYKWQIKNVWTSSLTSGIAIKTEENIPYVKLVFPLRANKSWNGNRYNSYAAENYIITGVHEPFSEAGLAYDSTVTVLQKDFTTLIGEHYQYEVFAHKVGLIKKKYIALDKEIDGTITRGVDYSYTLIEKGYDN